MSLYIYHNRPISVTIPPDVFEWMGQYVNTSAAMSKSTSTEWVARQLKHHRLAAWAFARHFHLEDQWKARHTKPSPWNPWTDFSLHGQKIRIVGVGLDETRDFGFKACGRVWRGDYERTNNDVYVLAGWYAPYVDLIGWVGRDTLKDYDRSKYFDLQEPVTRPMSEL